jgi:hypothetical protein
MVDNTVVLFKEESPPKYGHMGVTASGYSEVLRTLNVELGLLVPFGA